MSDGLRRSGDYADMPRQLAWFIIGIKEVGLPAVVIGALLYICFVSQKDMTSALTRVAILMGELDKNDGAITENQRIILERLK